MTSASQETLVTYYLSLIDYIQNKIIANYHCKATIGSPDSSLTDLTVGVGRVVGALGDSFYRTLLLEIPEAQWSLEIDINPVSILGSWVGHVCLLGHPDKSSYEIPFESPESLNDILAGLIGVPAIPISDFYPTPDPEMVVVLTAELAKHLMGPCHLGSELEGPAGKRMRFSELA